MGPRDLFLAHRIRAHGGRWSLRVVLEARRVDLPISLACALIEHESGWANVFGHDPTIFVGAGTVTKTKYLTYRAARGTTKCQGVGPCQLTYWGFQDKADRYGGCWKPRYNIRVAFEVLAANIQPVRNAWGSEVLQRVGSGCRAVCEHGLGSSQCVAQLAGRQVMNVHPKVRRLAARSVRSSFAVVAALSASSASRVPQGLSDSAVAFLAALAGYLKSAD
jgi:hypothetical protein